MRRLSITKSSSLEKEFESSENEDYWTYNAFYEDEFNNSGNLQNLDRMPSEYGTTFGQRSTGSVPELSAWFSTSPHTIHGNYCNFSGQSSSMELKEFDRSSEFTRDNTSFSLNNESLAEVCASWLGTEIEGASQMLWSQYQTGGRRKHRLMQSDTGFYALSSSLGTFQSPPFGDHDPFSVADSVNLMHPAGYFVKLEEGLVMQRRPVKDLSSFAECENGSKMPSTLNSKYDRQHMESSVAYVRSETNASKDAVHKMCHKKQSHAPLDIKNPCNNFMCQVPSSDLVKLQDKSFPHQGDAKIDTKLPKTILGTSMNKIFCSNIQEKTMIKVSSDDVSLGSASFKSLQNELGQLDNKIKLGLRDFLYRMARNVEMRRCTGNINHDTRSIKESAIIPAMQEFNPSLKIRVALIVAIKFRDTVNAGSRPSDFMKETFTNPIDQSLAHLLFNTATDPLPRPDNLPTSMDHVPHGLSRIILEPIMPGDSRFLCLEDSVSDTERSILLRNRHH